MYAMPFVLYFHKIHPILQSRHIVLYN